MQRRSFLGLALAALPATRWTRRPQSASTSKTVRVASGQDREGKSRSIGLSATTYKVLTADTAGALFVLEQSNATKGGPTRHLHHVQDELFYVLEGEYVVEIGSERFNLEAGDSVLGPREIPHAWAFVGNTPGKLLISFAPAGQMEAFFNERGNRGLKPGQYTSDAAFMHAYGMELVGPALRVE
jgi:mannose-6-phosphate isomerase-like protein (cupin superfamily)